MAKQIEQKEDQVLDTPEVKEQPQLPEKVIVVLCEKGEFGFGGQMYHHDRLDLETAQMLIDKGYPYLKIN